MNRAEMVKLAKEGLLSTHELTAAVIEMAKELELVEAQLRVKELCLLRSSEFIASLGYTGDLTAEAAQVWLCASKQQLERRVAEARRLVEVFQSWVRFMKPEAHLIGRDPIALKELQERAQRFLAATAKGAEESCTHEHLDMDGVCHACGADKRGIG